MYVCACVRVSTCLYMCVMYFWCCAPEAVIMGPMSSVSHSLITQLVASLQRAVGNPVAWVRPPLPPGHGIRGPGRERSWGRKGTELGERECVC